MPLHLVQVRWCACGHACAQQQCVYNVHTCTGGGAGGGANNQAHNAAVIAEASRLAAVRAQQQQQQQLLLQAIQTNGSAANGGLNAATMQALLAQQQQPSRNVPMPQPQLNPQASLGLNTQPAASLRPAQNVQDINYKDKLVEMGIGLAQNSISIETAVNSGLLGGLSAADVRVLATAHAAEMRRQQQQPVSTGQFGLGGGVMGGNGAGGMMGGNGAASQGMQQHPMGMLGNAQV